MASTASMFAKRMVEAERERLKDKERAARDMMEAVEGLRAAADRLRTAVGAYMELDSMTRSYSPNGKHGTKPTQTAHAPSSPQQSANPPPPCAED